MVAATLLAAGAVSVIVGGCFVLVARAVLHLLSGAHGLARRAYGAWWGCLGAYLVIHGAFTMAAGTGRLDADLYFASRLVLVPVLCLGVWGLTSYLLYLYTGHARVFAWVAAFYAAVAVLFYWATFQAERTLRIEQWLVTVDDAGLLFRAVYVAVGLPPIIAALAYLLLLRKVASRLQRYRIVLVSGSILAYVGSGLAARLLAHDLAIFLTLVVFGAIAAGAALMAFHPPPGIARWLERTPAERERLDEDRRKQRQRRLGELV